MKPCGKSMSTALKNQIVIPRHESKKESLLDVTDVVFAFLVGSCFGMGIATLIVETMCRGIA